MNSAFAERSEKKVLRLPDGVSLLGYYSRAQSLPRGLVILFHGWEGSADSHYMLSLGGMLNSAGLDVFRLNFRDHGGSFALNEGIFHSCRIQEVVDAVKRVQDVYPVRPVSLVGYSLGGNFALRVAARAKSAGIALDKVIAVCPVLRPDRTMTALETGFFAYRHYYLTRWRRSLLAKQAAYPKVYDFGDLKRFRTLTDTTRFFVEEYTELSDLDTYLKGYAITGSALAALSVPARVIFSADDPIIPIGDLSDLYRAESLEITVTDHGGHCGFLSDYRLRSWLDREVREEILGSGG